VGIASEFSVHCSDAVDLNTTAVLEKSLLLQEHGLQACVIGMVPAEQVQKAVADKPSQFVAKAVLMFFSLP
jgi:hypothetical protein